MAEFPTTHWSLLAKASFDHDGNTEGRKALEELCRRYWGPVYRFIRSRGFSEAEAEDLTQDFMVHLLTKSTFGRADRLRGRFRSFLLGALGRFLGDEADRRRARKRGGAVWHISFDAMELAPDGEQAPVANVAATFFDREWALTVLETALSRVRQEYIAGQCDNVFEILKTFLPGAIEPPSYEQAAGQIGVSVAALKSQIHRLRQRFRVLVREEVAQTVSAPHEIDAEIEHLQQVLMDKGSEFGARTET